MKTVLLIPLIFGVLAGTGFRAVGQSIADQARAGMSEQKDIQVNVHALVDTVDGMIDEYQRNGLYGDDIKKLKSLRGILVKLSEKDMARILVLLQQAGAQNDPAAALNVIAAAYSEQKGVLVEMRQILAIYAGEQEALELSNEAKDLADRQAANLQTGIESAQYASSHPDQTPLAAAIQGQAAEQKAIGDEMVILQTKIVNFAKDPNNQELADRFNSGAAEAAQIIPVLGSAADSLDQKKLDAAVTSEKDGRDKLRQLVRTLAPPEDPAEALQEAAEQLERIISQQKDVITATKDAMVPMEDYLTAQLHANTDLFRWAQKNGLLNVPVDQLVTHKEVQDASKGFALKQVGSNAPAIESEEGDLTNQTDSLVQDLETLAKPAADALNAAIPPMQGARSALAGNDIVNASPPEKDALASMLRAKSLLMAQLAEADQADEKSDDPVSDLEDLLNKTQALKQDQDTLDKDTAASKTPQQTAENARQQTVLQTRAGELVVEAAAQAPEASTALGNAATNMGQAAVTIPNPRQAAETVTQQDQAMKHLQEAIDLMQQQLAELQKDQKDLNDTTRKLEAVEKLIEEEQKLQGDTIQAAELQAKQPAGVTALAPRQQDIRGETSDFQKTLAADPQQTNGDTRMDIAASAYAHMGDAQGHLQLAQGKAADPDETQTLDDLYKLKDDLNAEIQKDEKALSQQDEKADESAAEAPSAISQAQTDLAKAMSEIAQNQNDPAASQLSQDATAVADQAAKADGLPQGATDLMRDAAHELANTAAKAGAGKKPDAQAAGAKAKDALAAAAAALAQNQAGNAPAGPPGNTPGSKPGKMAGKHGNTQITGAARSAGTATVAGSSLFLGVPPRDRHAVQEAQSEKYPQQYATKVEQYMENISNDRSP